jgi:hypothetical protein
MFGAARLTVWLIRRCLVFTWLHVPRGLRGVNRR